MKLSCKRNDFTYTPGEEIFNFPEESGLPFIFDQGKHIGEALDLILILIFRI